MRVLWIATKIPWPPRDGGRLLLYNSLRALAEAGHDLTLIAPTLGDAAGAERASAELRSWCRLVAVPARLRGRAADVLRASISGRPWTVERHRLPAMRRRVRDLLGSARFDLVQAEQVQALGSLPSSTGGPPVVWRAQNVESDLWVATAEHAGGWRRAFIAREARRLARWEGAMVRRAAATLVLSREDGARLAVLAGDAARLHFVAAPFEGSLPAARRALAGDPAVVLLGSGGWLPNRRGARWFVDRVWPRVRERLPGAVLHAFGEPPPRTAESSILSHPPPAESRDAFSPGSILAVPLDVASGIRMKILEAWARGIAVVATPAAVRGLGAEDGRHLLVARTPDGLAAACHRLHHEKGLREALAGMARERLREEHRFERIAGRWSALYETLTSESSPTSSPPREDSREDSSSAEEASEAAGSAANASSASST